MALLTKIEDIISIPMELFHKQKGFHPVDLNRMALRCMERGCRRGIKQVYAPNRFEVTLNQADYKDLQPFLDIIRSDITGELRRVIEERNFLLAGDLTVEIIEHSEIPEGLPSVNGYMQGDKDHESTVSYSDLAEEWETDDRPFYMDADTVFMVPESEPETTPEAERDLNEGITNLKEGQAQEDHKGLVEAKEELEGLPRYHAALAVALEMLNRRIEAVEHYRELETLEGGRTKEQQRIAWLDQQTKQDCRSSLPLTVLGRLEIKGSDATLHLGIDGVFLENKASSSDVLVNGQVVTSVQLVNGDKVHIGDLWMTFSSGAEMTSGQDNEIK